MGSCTHLYSTLFNLKKWTITAASIPVNTQLCRPRVIIAVQEIL